MTDGFSFDWFYRDFPQIEGEFQRMLDESLEPRGPDLLFDLVDRRRRPTWSHAVDVGCGKGAATLRLAGDFGLDVTGVDPVEHHLAVCEAALADAEPSLRERVRFQHGLAEQLPIDDESVDLVWCRDVLSHVADLEQAYREFGRVLRRGGLAIVYQMFGTDLLEPREAAWLWETMGVASTSAVVDFTVDAIAAADLRLVEHIVIGSEWGEWSEERHGDGSRRLLHAARLGRDPDRYIARFGRAAYEGMLGDCLWSVYAMLGKLSRHILVVAPP